MHSSRAALVTLITALLAAGCEASGPIPRYADASGGEDRDLDGAPDRDDACPDAPEDGLAPKANDGCPDTDTDEDGVSLADDRCPDAKEDGEAPNPADGCPAKDSDGDGVADAKDACADKPEDNLGPQKSDGCPALDGDSDGIADILDKCPSEPETTNGFHDADGCADATPAGDAAYDAEFAEIWVAEAKRFRFEPGSAELTAGSKPTLAAVAEVLKAHPEIQRLEIEVHVSSVGDEKQNVTLTQERANALARGIAALGVASGRLVPIGYGEYCPAIDRGDEKAEPSNERVAQKTVLVRGVWQTAPRGCWRAKAKGIDPTQRGVAKRPVVLPNSVP